MKNQLFIALLAVSISLTFFSCEEEPVINTYDQPSWTVNYTNHSASMTGVFALPDSIAAYVHSDDLLAAFINGECRGVTQPIQGLFFLNIVGTPQENGLITFKYYSSQNRYLYQEEGLQSFAADQSLGSADQPYVLNLKNM